MTYPRNTPFVTEECDYEAVPESLQKLGEINLKSSEQ